MVLRLGLYFGGLAVDYVTGQANSVKRVQYRAAQLRCVNHIHRAHRHNQHSGDVHTEVFPPVL